MTGKIFLDSKWVDKVEDPESTFLDLVRKHQNERSAFVNYCNMYTIWQLPLSQKKKMKFFEKELEKMTQKLDDW